MSNFQRSLLLALSCLFFACSSSGEDEVDPLASDVTPPSLQLSFAGFPFVAEGTPIVVSNQIVININAQDANGISKVEAFLNGDKVGEDTSAPFQITVDVSQLESKSASGSYKEYTLEIVATDRAGNTASKQQLINVDNELPVISEVSLVAETVLNGTVNPFTFQVSDNESLTSVSLYVNNELLTELDVAGPFESNLDTTVLPDGPSTLKIEAVDLAGNTATFEVSFISDNLGPEVSFSALTEGIIIDESILLNPVATDEYSDVVSVDLKFNGESLVQVQADAIVDYLFDPEIYTPGTGSFEVTAEDALGNISVTTVSSIIQRRLIEINIPENKISQEVSAAVVFLSRMDGTLIVWKEILDTDRKVVLSIPEEFDMSTEFMLSFYLQDNGGITTVYTHQNLTRGNPGILNLSPPVRVESDNIATKIPRVNFLSNDGLKGESVIKYGLFQSMDQAPASYTAFIDSSDDTLTYFTANDPMNNDPFDQIYVYDFSTFDYILIPSPTPADYVLDKANMTNQNLETRQFTVSSSTAQSNIASYLIIGGALSQADDAANKYHTIYEQNIGAMFDMPVNYQINTSFPYYRHALRLANYLTERRGAPEAAYTIPGVSVDYSIANNQIDLSIQGTQHTLGRVVCFDSATSSYLWQVTFDSQANSSIILPELPVSISNPVKTAYQNGTIPVESVELVSYQSIFTYDQYIEEVLKNETNILQATDWYELVFKSRTGELGSPSRDYYFY